MVEDPIVKCRVCGNKMPLTGMSVDENRNLLCRKCKSKGILPQAAPKVEKKVAMPKGTKSYQCLACNYKFKRVPNSNQAMRCPYCSSDRVQEAENSAQKLIDDLQDMEDNRFFREK